MRESTPAEIALEVMQSESMMWLMVGANHPESHLDALRDAWDAYVAAGGRTWGQPAPDGSHDV